MVEALFNTDRWSNWTRHFGPPARLAPQVDDPTTRYVLTAFAYGCGLGPAEAARHLDPAVSERVLRFVNRRHVSVDDLRAACTDLIDVFARFDLPRVWGDGTATGADGSLVEAYSDSLLSGYHARYRRTGGIAYRHVADNYVALFSRFISPGVHESVYVLDGLLQNRSSVRPSRVHADTHGQSECVFGLAHLLGIELMPRIRNWRRLHFYRPDPGVDLTHTRSLYHGSIDWQLIVSAWPQFLRLIDAIQRGRLSTATLFLRLNSYSRRNTLFRGLQEIGRAVRTVYLLGWINDEELRREVTATTNKVESFHAFARHLNFGGRGVVSSNNPVEQEKRTVYNQLVSNAVMLQTVTDQTRALNQLHEEGRAVDPDDLDMLSPYATNRLRRFGEYRSQYAPTPLPETAIRAAIQR